MVNNCITPSLQVTQVIWQLSIWFPVRFPFITKMAIFLAPSPSAAWVGLVGALQLRQFTGGLAGGEVDGLEDLLVQLPRLVLGTMGTMSQRCPFIFLKDPTKRMGVGRWVKYDII